MGRKADPCELGIHCEGKGRIQLLVIAFDSYVCIKCAAGEEELTQCEVREHLRSGKYDNLIKRARTRKVRA